MSTTNFNDLLGIEPAAPVWYGFSDRSTSDIQNFSNGGVSYDANPVIAVGGDIGSTVKFFDNGVQIGSVVITKNVTLWVFPTLSNGAHHISMTETSEQGLTGPATNLSFTVSAAASAAAPDAPVFMGLIDHTVSNYADFTYGATLADANPSISLAVTIGDTLKFYDNGVLIGSMVATSKNTLWTCPTLANGAHDLSVTQTSASGVEGAAVNLNFTIAIAAAAPDAPVFMGLIDHTVSNYADFTYGATLADANPSISLAVTIGDTLKFYDNGVLIGSMVATSKNTLWTCPTLANGAHDLSMTQTSASGVEGAASNLNFTIAIAAAAPDAPVFMGLIDHTVSNYADFTYGATLADANPSISLAVTIGDTLKFYDNGVLIGSMVATSKNTLWTCPTLANGAHDLSVTQTSASGVEGAASNLNFTIAIAAAAPDAPVFMGLIDHTVSNYADFTYGATLADANPSISLAVTIGDTLKFYDNGVLIGSMVATSKNTLWTCPTLANGAHDLSVTQTSASGVEGAASNLNFTIAIAAAAPDAPVFMGLIDHTVSNYADFTYGATLADANPSISLAVTIGDTLKFYDNGVLIGSMVATSKNTLWTCPTLANGAHDLSMTQTSASGVEGAASNLNFTIAIAAAAPDAPVFMGLIDHTVSNYADFTYGATLADANPSISLAVTIGDTLKFYDNGVLIGSMVATSKNTLWTCPTLANGAHDLSVTQTSASGVEGAASNLNFTIAIAAAAPDAPVFMGLIDHTVSNYADFTYGATLADANPSISLAVTIGDTLKFYDNGVLIGSMVATSKNTLWTCPTLANGAHDLSVTQTSASGVEGAASNLNFTIAIAAAAPDAPVFMGLIDHTVSNYADFTYGATLADANPSISLAVTIGDTLKFYDNGVLIGSMVATSKNTLWTCPTLANGAHDLSVTQTSASGVEGAASNLNFTIAIAAPAPAAPAFMGMVDHTVSNYADFTNGAALADANPSISLAVTIGDTLKFYDNGVLIGSMVATSKNTLWTYPTLANGAHDLSVTQTSASGVEGAAMNLHFTITTAAPAPEAPHFLSVTDNSTTGGHALTLGGVSHDAHPVISVGGDVGSTVHFYDNGALIGSVFMSQGTQSWTAPVLANGVHVLSMTETNADGVTGPASGFSFIVSTPVIAAPEFVGMSDKSSGEIEDVGIGGTSHDANPIVIFNADIGSTVKFYDAGVLLGSVVVTKGFMPWTFPTLTDGEHHLSLVETNAAGQQSLPLELSLNVSTSTANVDATAAATATDSDTHVITALEGVFTATAAHQAVDLAIDPAAYFKQSTAHIEGNHDGVNIIHLSGTDQAFDLASLSGKTAAAKFSSVEAIDLGGHGNTLSLSLVDVLNLSQRDLFQTDGKQQMMVKGAASDTVDLMKGLVAGVADGNWEQHATTQIGGVVYNTYEHSGAHAELLIQQGVHVALHG